MKKKIIIGLALTASLLYFGISCGKKENASVISESTGTSESVELTVAPTPEAPPAPETPVAAVAPETPVVAEVVEVKAKPNPPDLVSIENDAIYKTQLLSAYRTIIEVNNNLNLPFLNDIVTKFNQEDKIHYDNAKRNLDRGTFNQTRINIINSTSNLYQLLVTPNTTITYQDLYYKLSKLTEEIKGLKTITDNFIERLNMAPMTKKAKNDIIKGTNADPNKGFIGFQKINEKYNGIKFNKKTINNEEIIDTDWITEKNSGYTPPSAVAEEAPKDPSLVTLTHDKRYKEQLLTKYRKFLEIDFNLKSPFYNDIVKGINTVEKGYYDNSMSQTLVARLFDQKRIDIINSTSTLHKLLVTPNTNKTYREIYFKLSKILYEINELKISVDSFNRPIQNSMPSQLSQSSKNSILSGTNSDFTKGFIGFLKIYEIYNAMAFLKTNSEEITPFDWQKEEQNGYSPN
ncbi:hypothetical protein [Spirobacillus cienkowskii]|uniref:hypothetical protein n=1 Tax=Spirobacillus cienkowskii TaxID=495820 RepID=UPI0030D047A5